MARQKKVLSLQMEEKKHEVKMSNEAVLDEVQTEIDTARLELEKVKKEIEEKKLELQSTSRREISKEETKIVEKQVAMTGERIAIKEKVEMQKKYDSEKVTGKFFNQRAPGQAVKLPYIKYPEDPVKWHNFEHGEVYSIPRGFADQINEYYHTPTFKKKEGVQNHTNKVGENSAIAEVDTSNKKYAFVPVNF